GALLALAACASDQPATSGGTADEAATFVAVDIDWQSAPSRLPAGQASITLDNQGDIVHTLAFEGVDDDEPILEAQAGEAVDGTVTLEAGTYTYYCTVPGHRPGMEGTVEVTG
ncbi:MAG: hypothetical protein GEU81_18500, partial [Nitriliruptorales bacterium]|nr:hypothetical protein [Nitriliruptorales bacterium]